ncbi:cation:H+ antiporter [Marinobacter daqiaonensis]|uniref:Cation:H+ antiporter n=1 Tax=Marinobacter daqiaonensis TaxID=650891 RepID=A0A1I6HPU8_9GAMM|nr:sodium:calcium antiporter [Marinobacter daqiaonensis]SFR56404.1 cation:H+ antiporter [Marinobacter daqiaonensis]
MIAVAGTAVVWKGSGLLERSSERLSRYYQLPDIVQGAIVVAIGSSFPELATVVVSTLIHGEFELGVAAIVGSALFNILIIPALCGLAVRNRLATNRDLVYKEAQFYMISVAALLLMFSFAVIYNPVETNGGELRGELTRGMALAPLLLYGVYVFVQYQDTKDHQSDADVFHVRPAREWGRLAAGLGLILIGVEGLVRAAVNFGDILGTPSFLWGITVVAAGTSVPDAFVSVRAARNGKSVTSTANVLGSNIFDLLCCIPIGVLIAGTVVINYSVAAPMMAVLTLGTIILFLMMRTHMILSRKESWSLLMIYAAFILWIALESFDMVDLIVNFPPGT